MAGFSDEEYVMHRRGSRLFGTQWRDGSHADHSSFSVFQGVETTEWMKASGSTDDKSGSKIFHHGFNTSDGPIPQEKNKKARLGRVSWPRHAT
jgi:hypothetical protein